MQRFVSDSGAVGRNRWRVRMKRTWGWRKEQVQWDSGGRKSERRKKLQLRQPLINHNPPSVVLSLLRRHDLSFSGRKSSGSLRTYCIHEHAAAIACPARRRSHAVVCPRRRLRSFRRHRLCQHEHSPVEETRLGGGQEHLSSRGRCQRSRPLEGGHMPQPVYGYGLTLDW